MMKKIILILLLIIPLLTRMITASEISLLEQVEEDGFSKKQKNRNWEYVKENLFVGAIDRNVMVPKKFTGPILFNLNNATTKDSLATQQVINNLREVLPNKKIAHFSQFTNVDFVAFTTDISFKNGKIKDYTYKEILASTLTINFAIDTYRNKKGANEKERFLLFNFKENTTLEDRKKYIQYEVLKTICFAHKAKSETLFLNLNYPIEAIFNDPVYNVLDKEFTEIDQFLVQKLYADDFEEQFSDYMYATYPWRYANLFVNKALGNLKIYLFLGLFTVLLFVLSFSVFNRKETDYLDYFFPLLVVFLGLMNLYGMYVYFIEIQLPVGSFRNTLNVFLYVLVSAFVISAILWALEQKLLKHQFNFTYLFVVKLVITFVALNANALMGYYLTVGKVQNVIPLYSSFFYVFLTLTLGRSLLIYLNHYSESLIAQKEFELSRLKELNTKNELKSLHAHINPHFLYNALNSIAELTHENPNKAEKMIVSLSDLFRYSINRKGKKMSTVEDEVLMVKNYLSIEKERFGERLQYVFKVDEHLLGKEIPMYILQPLIENAVKHGIAKVRTQGIIKLEIAEQENNLLIAISDNGADFPEDLYGGYGLQSIYDLLRLSYGDKATLNWTNTPEKKITILIPSIL